MSFLSGLVSGGLLVNLGYRFRQIFPEWLRNEGEFITSGETYNYIQSKAQEMGITKEVLVTYIPSRKVANVSGMKIGSLCPEIIIGNDFLLKSFEEDKSIKGILAHELAHIKHNDTVKIFIPTISAIAVTILVNPLVGLFTYYVLSLFIAHKIEKEADLDSCNFIDEDTKKALIEKMKMRIPFDEFSLSHPRLISWRYYLRGYLPFDERIQIIEKSLKKT